MVISIIDGIDDEGLGADAIRNSLEKPQDGQLFPTTKWKIDDTLIHRDSMLRKSMALMILNSMHTLKINHLLYIVGEIIALAPKNHSV